jgi:hypothetical protein
MFILKNYFASKLSATVRVAFRSVYNYPDKEVGLLYKTKIYGLLAKLRYTESICLWQMLIKRQTTGIKQCQFQAVRELQQWDMTARIT